MMSSKEIGCFLPSTIVMCCWMRVEIECLAALKKCVRWW
jgi:hypothetical protein